MTIQSLENGATLGVQRGKINANFTELNQRVEAVEATGGPAGPQGPAGPEGPQGLQGVAGAVGAQGATGPAGPQGLQGVAGAVGAQGATGPAGPQGLQGVAGAVGAQGATGPAGPTTAAAMVTALTGAPELPQIQSLVSGYRAFAPGTSWRRVLSKVAALSAGVVSNPVVVTWGDSVAQYVGGPLRMALYNQFGGRAYGGLSTVTIVSSTGTITDVTGNYSYWPTGSHTDIAEAATRTFSAPGGQWFQCNTFKVFLVATPSGGNVTVDVLDAGSNILTTQTISALSGTPTLVTVTLSPSVTTQRVRVTSVTGTNTLIGIAGWNTAISGIVRCDMGVGGINLVDANSLTYPAILSGVMAVLQPALVTYSMREVSNDATHLANPESWITDPVNGVAAFVSKWAQPNTPWVFTSPTAAAFDSGLAEAVAPSYREGSALSSVAKSLGHSFVDSWAILGDWATITSRGNSGNDGIHIGAVEQAILADAALRAMGLGGMSNPITGMLGRIDSFYARRIYPLNDLASLSSGAYYGASGGGEDLQPTLSRWMDIRHTGGVRVARFSSGQGSDGGAGAIFASGALVQNTNYYEANGDYGLHVHPTTGVVTLYGRVGAVLKSLVLGTLL